MSSINKNELLRMLARRADPCITDTGVITDLIIRRQGRFAENHEQNPSREGRVKVDSVGTMTLPMVLLTVNTLLPISFALFLALMLTATNCSADMDANGQHSRRSWP
jgi:hypothetical protein